MAKIHVDLSKVNTNQTSLQESLLLYFSRYKANRR